jgi:multidrug efflux system membrane fusion protein
VVGKVGQKTVPVELDAVGNVEPYATVAIKAQVPGEILDVYFKEGDFVSKGQVLLKIDPRPYEAALAQAQAALARDKVLAENNRAQAKRYQSLLAEGVVSAQQVETFTSAADSSAASVSADEAAIKTTELNLEYCTIRSPIDGRTGTLMLKPGNLVKVADVPIVIINQVNPIFVNFGVPQQFWPDLTKFTAERSLHVKAMVPKDSGPAEEGTVTFLDNAVDTTTGMIHLRATFNNAHNRLWPGLFVNILLTLSQQGGATVVPEQAIVDGEQGKFVYVVNSENRVQPRLVSTSRTVEGQAVIDKGLRPGETIVTDGQARLSPNAKIEPKSDVGDADPPNVAGSRSTSTDKP